MQRDASRTEISMKLGLGALALAAIALPVANAFASAEDPAAAHATLTAEQVTKARELFNANSCNSCHALADAGASGSIGPSFDGDTALDKAYAVNIITNGQGAMPNFGWLGEEDIDLIASYIVQVKK